jgi:bacterioferritin-associated ferredoxin
MYVCICHAITDGEVAAAESQGAKNETEVFSHYGVSPKCGRCLNAMGCLLKCPLKSTAEMKTAEKAEPSRRSEAKLGFY